MKNCFADARCGMIVVPAPRAPVPRFSGSAERTVQVPIHRRSGVIQLHTLGSIDLREGEGRGLTGLLTQPKRAALLLAFR